MCIRVGTDDFFLALSVVPLYVYGCECDYDNVISELFNEGFESGGVGGW